MAARKRSARSEERKTGEGQTHRDDFVDGRMHFGAENRGALKENEGEDEGEK